MPAPWPRRPRTTTWAEVTNGTASDSLRLKDLLSATLTEHEVLDLCVDMGYFGNPNFELADSLNVNLIVPFPVGTKETSPNRRVDGPWERAYHFYHLHREEFLERYHPRSISETAFSMTKERFDGFVRGRNIVAQFNEVLCKVLAHNLTCLVMAMYEWDLDLSFGSSDSRLKLPDNYYRDRKVNGLSIYGTPKPEPQLVHPSELESPGGRILVT